MPGPVHNSDFVAQPLREILRLHGCAEPQLEGVVRRQPSCLMPKVTSREARGLRPVL